MTILITGAAGFIGTNLCKTLLEQGKKVVGVDNFLTGSKKNIAFLHSFPSFSFIEMDITDPLSAKKLLSHPIKEIYDLACPTGVDNLIQMPLEMLFASTIGVKNMLDLAEKKQARFLFASSSEVYGDPKITPQTEEYEGNVNPLNPRAAYEEGKRCAESIVAAYCRTRRVDAKIARIFNTYGPFFSEKDTRVIPQFLSQMKNGREPEIFGDGEQKRSFLYIDDLIQGFFLIMNKGEIGQAYNIGSEEAISINDLARMLIQAASKHCSIKHLAQDSLDLHNIRLPSIKKMEKLGWKKTVSLKEGLNKTMRFINEQLN
jgi:nucleoside-diphosphate-sugar epimerase